MADAGGSAANVAVALARLGRAGTLRDELRPTTRGARMLADHVTAAGVPWPPTRARSRRTSTALATIGSDGAAAYEFDLEWRLHPVPTASRRWWCTPAPWARCSMPAPRTSTRSSAGCAWSATISYDVNARPAITGTGPDSGGLVERMVAVSDLVKASDEDLEALYRASTRPAARRCSTSARPRSWSPGRRGATWVGAGGDVEVASLPVVSPTPSAPGTRSGRPPRRALGARPARRRAPRRARRPGHRDEVAEVLDHAAGRPRSRSRVPARTRRTATSWTDPTAPVRDRRSCAGAEGSRLAADCREPGARPVPRRPAGMICGCASGSTSPTTAPTSGDGRRSPGCARCRGRSRPPWPPRCGCPRCGWSAPGAPTPACTPAARSCTSTCAGERYAPRPAARTTRPPRRCARRLNGILAADVRVRRVAAAPAGFDARFSALWRRYAYRIADDPTLVDPLVRRTCWPWPRPLDLDAMNEAAALLLGEHDFAAFCRRREGATTIRTLLDLAVARDPDGLPVATVRADAFCHSMVRSLVGCLLAVGEGRRPVAWAGGGAGRRRARPRGDGRARARAHARGGRLPRRRRAGAPRGASPARPRPSAAMTSMDDHYFSADPSVPFERDRSPSVWGHELALASGSGVFSRRAASTIGTAVLFRETRASAPGRFLDLGCGYGVIGLAIAAAVPGATVTGVDVNERAVLLANENAAALGRRRTASPPATPDAVPARRDVRRDLVEPADPDRQGGAARAAAHLAAAAGARWPRGDGGRQEPRRRLAAALAGGAGLPDRRGLPARRASGCWRPVGRRSAEAGPQLALEHLQAGAQRQLVDEPDLPRVLVPAEPLAATTRSARRRPACGVRVAATTTAQISSPCTGSGTPMTATWATAGCRASTSSTSRG